MCIGEYRNKKIIANFSSFILINYKFLKVFIQIGTEQLGYLVSCKQSSSARVFFGPFQIIYKAEKTLINYV